MPLELRSKADFLTGAQRELLAFGLMATSTTALVTDKDVVEFLTRLSLLDFFHPQKAGQGWRDALPPVLLARVLAAGGARVNVSPETSAAWSRRVVANMLDDVKRKAWEQVNSARALVALPAPTEDAIDNPFALNK